MELLGQRRLLLPTFNPLPPNPPPRHTPESSQKARKPKGRQHNQPNDILSKWKWTNVPLGITDNMKVVPAVHFLSSYSGPGQNLHVMEPCRGETPQWAQDSLMVWPLTHLQQLLQLLSSVSHSNHPSASSPRRLNISQASHGSSEMLNGVSLFHKHLCPMVYWLYFNDRNQFYGSISICKKCWSGFSDVLKIREKVLFYKIFLRKCWLQICPDLCRRQNGTKINQQFLQHDVFRFSQQGTCNSVRLSH